MDFRQQIIRVEGIGGAFSRSERDLFKSDREMSVCEMDSVIAMASRESRYAERRADGIELNSLRGLVGLAPVPIDSTRPDPTPGLYCRAVVTLTEWLAPEAAEAQEQGSDSAATALGVDVQAAQTPRITYTAGNSPNARSAQSLRDRARSGRIRAANYLVEVHKKYAMATASIVFVLVGVPIALRFPRSGVGLVIGASLGVFTIYYVGLIGGESLANQLKVPASLAMWTPNVIFTVLGLAGLWHIRSRSTTPPGGTSLAWGLRTALLRGRPRA
jgi:lipopolysaccharide export system permease protein